MLLKAGCCFWLLLQIIWVQGAAARVPHLLSGVSLRSCAGTDNTLWQPSRRLLALQNHRTSELFACMMECTDIDSVNPDSRGSIVLQIALPCLPLQKAQGLGAAQSWPHSVVPHLQQ